MERLDLKSERNGLYTIHIADKPKEPGEVPVPEHNPEIIPPDESPPGVWPAKTPEVQPGEEPLTVPGTAPFEVPAPPDRPF